MVLGLSGMRTEALTALGPSVLTLAVRFAGTEAVGRDILYLFGTPTRVPVRSRVCDDHGDVGDRDHDGRGDAETFMKSEKV